MRCSCGWCKWCLHPVVTETPAAHETMHTARPSGHYQTDDGGRAAAGFKGRAGDCVTRAIAIATGIPYPTIYERINELAQRERANTKRKKGRRSSAREGVFKATYHRLLIELGWTWVPTMTIGSGCKVHLRASELPNGRLIVKCSKHLVAFIHGVVHDTHDPSRDGTRCVYGYYKKD